MRGHYRVPRTGCRVPCEGWARARVAGDSRARRPALRYSVRGARHAVLLFLLPFLTSHLSAQSIPLADSLWNAENYDAARVEYTRVLHQDPGNVRSLFRLAMMTAWAGQLDSALALLRDAREMEPGDPDVRMMEARVLAWEGRFKPALARYDSVIVEFPERSDARLGRAQTLAWAGRQREADEEYRSIAAGDPGYAEAMLGLAQLRLWQERLDEADHYNSLALRSAPQNRAGLDLGRQIRALRRPRIDLTLGGSHDSDDNTSWWQSIGASTVVGPGLRLTGSGTAYETKDPLRRGSRISGEAGVVWNYGNLGVNGAVGVSKLTSSLGPDRTIGTARFGGRFRLSPTSGFGAGYARYSFDETALLLARRLNVIELSADGDVEIRRNLNLSIGAGRAHYSDDNYRTAIVLAVNQQLANQFTVGVFGRRLWYDFRGTGYFSPDRFLLGEARVTYSRVVARWSARLAGGLGFQQAGRDASAEIEWHADLRLSRHWSTLNEFALVAAYNNSAISNAAGAFHYYSAALTCRIGL